MFDSQTMLSVLKNKKFWFTLIETVMVLSLFSLVVIGVIWAINRSYTFLSKTKLQVRATNLAREWVEQMFIIRNSNRRKWSWLKDKHWLDIDMTKDNTNQIFESWLYSLVETDCTAWKCIIAEKRDIGGLSIETCYSEDNFFSTYCNNIREKTKVIFTWTYTYLSWDDEKGFDSVTGDIATLLWWETDFYRLVRVFWRYKKDETNPDASINSDNDVTKWDPAEMRFCVKVFYGNWVDPYAVELCSIMTNFEE